MDDEYSRYCSMKGAGLMKVATLIVVDCSSAMETTTSMIN